MPKLRPKAKFQLSILLSSLALAGAGCESRQPDELARAVEGGEHPVAMKGTAVFFAGKLGVTITISRGIGHGTKPGNGGVSNARILSLEGMDKDEAALYVVAKNNIGSPLPPVTLRLILANQQAIPVSVEVEDFESDLGNFAVMPEVLSIAAGQSAAPDPMISQLGVTSDTIPIKVSLRLNGKVETQNVQVKSVVAPVSSTP